MRPVFCSTVPARFAEGQTIAVGSAAYLPAQQPLQLDLPWAFWNCPAAHSVHGLFAPTTALKVPAAQRVHADKAICPGDSLNLPLWHGRQWTSLRPRFGCHLPEVELVQMDAATSSLNLPASHSAG